MAARADPDDRRLRVLRAQRQLLDRSLQRASGPELAVRQLLAVQAQDRFAYPLALRARVEGLSWPEVERAISVDRTLVVSWLNRGTLHLVAREDYPWLAALTLPQRAPGMRRRLGQEGVTPDEAERAVGLIERMLGSEGPLTRDELRDRLRAQGIRVEGQALYHLLFASMLRGTVVFGPLRPTGHALALTRDWLGPEAVAALEEARRGASDGRWASELARRYLRGHGPADERDLARWAGIAVGQARAGIRAIASEIDEMDGLATLRDGADPLGPDDPLPPRLLPAYDPALLGWRSRMTFVPSSYEIAVYSQAGGLVRGVFTLDGLAMGQWRVSRTGDAPTVTLEPYEPLTDADRERLAAEIEDVERFERERSAWRHADI